jgi:hypothetical protein
MEFVSANPSVVRSIKQRVLLNNWLRAARKRDLPPLRTDFMPEAIADELPDMMGYDVVTNGDDARFLITQQGSRLAATYGNDRVGPDVRTNQFLDDALGPHRYARLVSSYRACVAHKRPTYSVSTVQDADGKDVSYERLLLPFGKANAVEQIVGSFKAISIEGRFQVNNLMGLKSPRVPVAIINAVIDINFVSAKSDASASDDVVELG